MYKKDLALNNLQWLIYYKTKPMFLCYHDVFFSLNCLIKTFALFLFNDDCLEIKLPGLFC